MFLCLLSQLTNVCYIDIDWLQNKTVSVFETTIRVLGGLLSAHLIATDNATVFVIHTHHYMHMLAHMFIYKLIIRMRIWIYTHTNTYGVFLSVKVCSFPPVKCLWFSLFGCLFMYSVLCTDLLSHFTYKFIQEYTMCLDHGIGIAWIMFCDRNLIFNSYTSFGWIMSQTAIMVQLTKVVMVGCGRNLIERPETGSDTPSLTAHMWTSDQGVYMKYGINMHRK